MKRLRFLFLESFYGGSHRAFADSVVSRSAHEITLLTLPARQWRQRMQTAAWELIERVDAACSYDGLIVSDLIDLTELRALFAERGPVPPVLLYMHESQLTYPPTRHRLPPRELFLQEIKNVAAADRTLFNSNTHRTAFVSAAHAVLSEYRNSSDHGAAVRLAAADEAAAAAGVHYPGADLPRPPRPVVMSSPPVPNHGSNHGSQQAPTIVWNHRLEYDKAPGVFFRTLNRLASAQLPFEVVLLGERSTSMRRRMDRAVSELGDRVRHYGYVESRDEYQTWLERGEIVVSTAEQENFGIAVCEAVLCGCLPVLPHRLSYPELVPDEFHRECLYQDERHLYELLRRHLSRPTAERRALTASLQHAFARFDCRVLAPLFDRELEALV